MEEKLQKLQTEKTKLMIENKWFEEKARKYKKYKEDRKITQKAKLALLKSIANKMAFKIKAQAFSWWKSKCGEIIS